MNRHPTFLGVLGILPNQLRTLLKETGYENREEALLDLSRTLFFAGFSIWKKRKQLANRYWNEVGQRIRNGIIKKRKKRKKETVDQKLVESNCHNFFHYLPRHDNLSKQRPTRCPCRNVVILNKVYPNQPITEFLFKYNKEVPQLASRTTLPRKIMSSSKNNSFITRTDATEKNMTEEKNVPLNNSC